MNFLETLKENNLSFKPNLSSSAAKTNKKDFNKFVKRLKRDLK